MAQPKPGGFLPYVRFFNGLVGRHLPALIVLMLLATWAEGLGIALLLPLFSGGGATGALGRAVAQGLAVFGLSLEPKSVLLALVVVAFVKAALTFSSVAYQYWISERMTLDLRRSLITGASRADYKYMLATNSGTLSSLIYGHTVATAAAFITFSKLFPHILTILVFFGILAYVDWKLTLVVAISGAAIASLLRYPVRLAKRYSTRIAGESAVFAGLLNQILFGFKYLTATNSVEPIHRRVFESIRRLTVQGYKNGAMSAFAYALPQPIIALFLAGMLLYQLHVSPTGIATGFVMLVYLYRMMNEMFALQLQWQTFAGQTGAVDAVVAALKELEASREKVGGAPFTFEKEIVFRGVSFAYQERRVLQSIDLTIPRRKTIAFVGESGSGKTTLVDMVSGILRPTEGAVLVDGRDLREIDLLAWRSRIGYVPQDAAVFEDSVANNISLWTGNPKDPAFLARVQEAAVAANCDEFVRGMPEGYDSPIGERGTKVSGGQRQRLSIARELFKKPEILILDEATSALDSESERYIQQSIERLKGSLTILVIAHRLSTIKGCDYLYVLQDGRLVEQGTWSELIGREGSRFREMARMQNL